MTRNQLKTSAVITLSLIAYSCTTNTVFHKYHPIDEKGWSDNDTVYFQLPDSMATGKYKTEIGIRHTNLYPYKDIWLSIKSDNRDKTDTIHIYLVNDRGNWNGNGSTGGYYQYSVPITELNDHLSSDSIIKVYHIMKDNPLSGITDVGLKIIRE